MNRKIIILALTLLGMATGSALGAEARFSTSRTYVMGYMVQGDFALPVMGVITDEVRIGVGRVITDGRYVQLNASFSTTMTPNDAAAVSSFLQDTIPSAGK